MFLACGLSAYNLAMFHLFIHAFFKALLFLCAGSVIHSLGDEQDVRRMGSLYNYLPITYAGLLIGFLSLAGLPFTSGFFSKDTIIELAMTKRTVVGGYAYICATLGAWYTGFYTFRFFFHVLFKRAKLSRSKLFQIFEHGPHILTVIFILTIITIFIGAFTKNPLTSPVSFLLFNDSIFVQQTNFYFSWFEGFLRWYITIHNYDTLLGNYMKLILFITPFFALYVSGLFYAGFNHEEGSIGYIYELLEFKHRPYWMRWAYNYPSEPYLKGFAHMTKFELRRFFETRGGMDQIYN
jgi:NADH-quinone oxidoreductase subunit L